MYKDTITLFNGLPSSSGQVWRATVLHNVDLNADKTVLLARLGPQSDAKAKLHVRFSVTAQGDAEISTGALIVEPKQYAASVAADQAAITFRAAETGETPDFFIFGEWTGAGVISDDDYPDGFANYMFSIKDRCYSIEAAARYSVIPHYEILAR